MTEIDTLPAQAVPARMSELRINSDRSGIVRSYLATKGFNTKYLAGGLLGLADKLKGMSSEGFPLEPGK